MKRKHYPPTRRVTQIDTYFGHRVADPYRWLEGRPTAWIDAQNRYSSRFFKQCPATAVIRAHMEDRQAARTDEKPRELKHGDRIFFWSKGEGDQGEAFWCKKSADAEATVALDLRPGGDLTIAGVKISPQGRYIAYGVTRNGSHYPHIRVRDVDSGKDLPEELAWIPGGSSWVWKDDSGFFYTRYVGCPAGESDPRGRENGYKLCFHVPGTDQETDAVWYERPEEPACGFEVEELTERFLLVGTGVGSTKQNGYLFKDLAGNGSSFVELFKHSIARFDYVAHQGSLYWFFTDLDAPRGRLISVDLDVQPGGTPEICEVIGQTDDLLTSISRYDDGRFFAVFTKDVISVMKEFNADGSFRRDLETPGVGTIYRAPALNKDKARLEYGYTDMLTSYDTYTLDPDSGKSTLVPDPSARRLDPTRFVSKQVFYTSKDGTRIPMFLCHRADLKLDGKNPVWMSGYGGFGESTRPSFTPEVSAWLEMGGVFAEPCIRGGAEYGEPWHQAATRLLKQVTFDDFIAAAQWLIANGYTRGATKKRRSLLAISGTSNGGLLVAACLVQRPDLFGAVIANSGLMDMLRYDTFPAGKHWRGEFGSAYASLAEFLALFAYAPYQNVKRGVRYPAVLLIVGDGDDIVDPSHSYKFAAALQRAQAGDAPILLHVVRKVGHGAHGSGRDSWRDDLARKMGFLVKVLKIDKSRWQHLNSPAA